MKMKWSDKCYAEIGTSKIPESRPLSHVNRNIC